MRCRNALFQSMPAPSPISEENHIRMPLSAGGFFSIRLVNQPFLPGGWFIGAAISTYDW
jgi:hypothetical protein